MSRDKRRSGELASADGSLYPSRLIRTYPSLPAKRSTEHGVTEVGLMRVRRSSPHLTNPCDGAHYGYFAAQPVWRYATSLAGSAAIGRSAYY